MGAALALRAPAASTCGMKTVLVLNQDQMGHGDRELGRQILATFLRKAVALPGLTAIVFYNSGVNLVAEDSPVLAELDTHDRNGVDILPCGTCLEAFGLEPVVGSVSSMDAIVGEIGRADKVLTL